MSARIIHGDCLAELAALSEASVDAIVTDPPYGLGFMGKAWDDLPPGLDFAREALRVLKPGGHLLAFGGTRTWHRLAVAVEDAGFEIRDSIAWLYGSGFPKSLDVSKAIDKAAGAARPVVGINPRAAQQTPKADVTSLGAFAGTSPDLTAAATPEAAQWQGWGTALKPSHEPVVWGVKPLTDKGYLARIGSHLDRLENEWRALAAESITPTGEVVASSARTATYPSGSTVGTGLNIVSSWKACWDELCSLLSTSTTETTSSTTTDLRTLSSCLERLTASSTLQSETNPLGLTSSASAVESLFVSAVFGLRATLALSADESATRSTPTGHQDAEGRSPAFEPIIVARKPLAGTVAANVLEHGTGALNIDGCRIEFGEESVDLGRQQVNFDQMGYGRSARDTSGVATYKPGGRWPANVCLDEDQAAALDEQSGTKPPSARVAKGGACAKPGNLDGHLRGVGSQIGDEWGYNDSGGASRFFYVAKAPKKERPVVDGVAHPTVKPLALMRWLVRLVTPPGGIVLDPFAGSGTTVEAAILEGFDVIGVEREAEYLPLIEARIARQALAATEPPEEPTLDFGESA